MRVLRRSCECEVRAEKERLRQTFMLTPPIRHGSFIKLTCTLSTFLACQSEFGASVPSQIDPRRSLSWREGCRDVLPVGFDGEVLLTDQSLVVVA